MTRTGALRAWNARLSQGVRLARPLNAVGSHQDGAGEGVEVLLLVLPRAPVVAREVRKALQAGIGVRRQQFAKRALRFTCRVEGAKVSGSCHTVGGETAPFAWGGARA